VSGQNADIIALGLLHMIARVREHDWTVFARSAEWIDSPGFSCRAL